MALARCIATPGTSGRCQTAQLRVGAARHGHRPRHVTSLVQREARSTPWRRTRSTDVTAGRDVALRASSSSADGPAEVSLHSSWDGITQQLVATAAVPFTLLVLPQVAQNFQNITAGNIASLSAVSWLAYASGMLGNTLMLTHFVTQRERNALGLQLLGIASNLLVLSQVAWAGYVPLPAFVGIVAAGVSAVALCLTRAAGRLPAPPLKEGMSAWRTWQLGSGTLCLALVPQILWAAVRPDQPTLLPAVAAAICLRFWVARQVERSTDGGTALADALPGWAATTMFALAPLPQLVRCFTDPNNLQGLSVGTMLLGLLGNALMVPRALLTKDRVWLLGASWATLAAGWAQLLSLFLGRDPLLGTRYLSGSVLAVISVALGAYLVTVTLVDSRAKGLPSPLHSVGDALFGK